jgi:hypothetical protein
LCFKSFLQNTSNLKVLRERMTPDATYVSLNFNNPALLGARLGSTGRFERQMDHARCREVLGQNVADNQVHVNPGKKAHFERVSWQVYD